MSNDDLNGGPMENFNLETFLTCAKEYVRCDEVERALWLLDNLPGFYRDHVPLEVHNLRGTILGRLATPRSYSIDQTDVDFTDTLVKRVNDSEITPKENWSLRFQLSVRDVEILNAAGHTPNVVDFGPGEYALPTLLKHVGAKFKYLPLYLNHKAHEKIIPHINDYLVDKIDPTQPTVYVACEIIEHLWNETEIKAEMIRAGGLADIVHLSTPKYAFDRARTSWEVDHIGHLRTYTPREFMAIIQKQFYEYAQTYYDSQVMHIRCVRYGTSFESVAKNTTGDILKAIT